MGHTNGRSRVPYPPTRMSATTRISLRDRGSGYGYKCTFHTEVFLVIVSLVSTCDVRLIHESQSFR